MSTYRLSSFTQVPHTLVVELAGVAREWERWRYGLWRGDSLIITESELETPRGWSEDKVAAAALFWATLPPEERESSRYDATSVQREWLDDEAPYLSLALLGPDGDDVDTLSAYRIDE